MYVSVPRDLSRVKSKIIFNLTKRQLLCFGAAALIGVPAFFLIKKTTANVSLAAMSMIVIMLPLFFLAMYERDGQPLEVIARHFIETKFIRPKIRPYRTDNYYRTLERQAWAEEEVAKIVRRHQETAEKPVRKKGTGAKHKAAGKPHKARAEAGGGNHPQGTAG